MIFACQHCGGLEPYIIAIVLAAWGGLTYTLARVRSWFRPVK
jgi:hypothetical protein